ncbi:MAG: hypothetical protein GC152_08010 [Alphaproteobacteria bacterium]|nr:hypothetical protein [Alphaproteobacteria bacterium]
MAFRSLPIAAIGSLAATAAASFAPAAAQDIEFTAEVSAELRYFADGPAYAGQIERWQPSIVLEPELRWSDADRTHQVAILPFYRADFQDEEREHFDLREAYYRYNDDDGWSVTLGLAKVFWGRTESRHLVDIINQSDSVEDIDEEDKLGQPMAHLSVLRNWGTLDFFVMTGFRDRTFPGADGRLRFELVVDTDDPIFERDGRRAAPDFAARYSHYVGSWDFGVAVFHGTSREPRFAIEGAGGRIRPVYDRITQGSIDLQYTKDAWLWKAEAIVREGHGDAFFAAVAGFEYTLYQVFGTGADLGLLTEYQHDGRDEGLVLEDLGLGAPTSVLAAPVTVANDDVFMGARLALNDLKETTLLVGGTIDVADQSTGMFIEAERRLGENWAVELQARLFLNADPGNVLFVFREDDFLNLRVTRYF